jgi:hypothetical protein
MHMACHSEPKEWNAHILCIAHPWKCTSAYSCSHLSAAGAFHLGVLWPHSLEFWSRSERQPPVNYLRSWLGSQR